MASAATQKWNARFARAKKPANAAKVLHNHIEFLPQQGTAVDLACGLGGNALLLANHGLATSAWDAAEIGLAKLQLFAAQQQLTVTTRQVDLESDIFPAQTFDIVTVSHYLHRPLFPKIIAALNNGGIVFYQTFTRANAGNSGPSNPDFLLTDHELLAQFSSLETMFYQQDDSNGIAYYIGRKPS